MLPSSRASSARSLIDALHERRCGGAGRETKPTLIDRRRRPNLRRPPRLDLPLSCRGSSSLSAAASPSPSEEPPSPASSAPDFIVRRATEEDWWHLSQVHCASFFPKTPSLLVPLLRLDRVLGIEAGASSELKGKGRFACLVAVRVGEGEEKEEEKGREGEPRAGKEEQSEGAAGGEGEEQPSFPLSLLPRQLRGCFESLEAGATRAGVLGAVCVDAQGCQLPPRKLPLKKRSAAVASFVALVSPNTATTTEGPPAPSASPSPSASSQGLRAPPGTVAYLSNLAVSPEARELGVGRALLRAAESEAWSWGCRSAALHVGRENAAAAGLYLSSGFRAVGGALPLVDPAAADKGDRKRPETTARQQLAGGPLTLMLKVAPASVRRAREKAAAEAAKSGSAASSSSSPSLS